MQPVSAVIHYDRSGVHINFVQSGVLVDEAGPFDDETDAIAAAERGVVGGVVIMPGRAYLTADPTDHIVVTEVTMDAA